MWLCQDQVAVMSQVLDIDVNMAVVGRSPARAATADQQRAVSGTNLVLANLVAAAGHDTPVLQLSMR